MTRKWSREVPKAATTVIRAAARAMPTDGDQGAGGASFQALQGHVVKDVHGRTTRLSSRTTRPSAMVRMRSLGRAMERRG